MFIDAAHTATGRTRESRHTDLDTALLTSARSVYGSFQARCIDAQWVASRRPRLQALARVVAEKEDTLVKLLSEEGHRPVSICRTEARRSVQTIQKTEEALVRLAEPRALDFSDAAQGAHAAMAQRFTCAPLFAIVPFNFPLNLALHKIGPALALGIPFVCKGPVQNPKAMQLLAECIEKAGFPTESFLLFQSEPETAEALLESVPFPLLSFTGSRRVGLHLKKKFWDRKVMLELGSTAAVVLCDDVPRWELELISQSLARSAFAQGGQSCISLQHLFLEPDVAGDLVSYLKDAATRLADRNDLADEETLCSPVVSLDAAEKVASLLADATQKGATVWSPPSPVARNADPRDIPPTLVFMPPLAEGTLHTGMPKLLLEEAFGPIVCIHRLAAAADTKTLAAALATVDANIHASIYTYDSKRAKALFEASACHALLWNEVPSWRADAMPYGGTLTRRAEATLHGLAGSTHTGLVGGEGPLYAMREYTWERLFVLP
ncbi:MAG: aldehyde dehydrogenase family protein [Silvanigrellales bacterium]|nr:aldehyde dehydrogenase family protein [Silvanigrellales bacterium]